MNKKIGILIVLCLVIGIVLAAGNGQVNKKAKVNMKMLNDKIDKTSDGIVEIDIDNPLQNGLNVDLSMSGTSGIYFLSDSLPLYGGQGTVGGSIVVPPGQKTLYITIKSDIIGNYKIQINGEYYTEADIDVPNSQKLSFTQIIKVIDKSDKIPEDRYFKQKK